MQFSDVFIGEKRKPSAALDSLSPSSLVLLFALVGPLMLLCSCFLSTYAPRLAPLFFSVAFLGTLFIWKWETRGVIAALGFVFLAYALRVVGGSAERAVWEAGMHTALGIAFVLTYLALQEASALFDTAISDYKMEYETLCEQYHSAVQTRDDKLADLHKQLDATEQRVATLEDEAVSLNNVVHASSAQAHAFSQKNKALHQQAFALHRENVELKTAIEELKASPKKDQQLLDNLNTYRVEWFQQKALSTLLQQSLQPMKPAPLPKPKEDTAPQEALRAKESEKTALKKAYYEVLDRSNDLKLRSSKAPENAALKEAFKAAYEELKAKKAALVDLEKEIFNMKKELRDQGQLFAASHHS